MNRSVTTYLFSICALLFLSARLNAQAINPNGGFETGAPGTYTGSGFSGWDFQLGAATATFEITTDAEYVLSGSQALKVTMDSLGNNQWEPQAINTDFAVESGITYHISVWAKADVDGAVASFTMGSLSPNYYEWGRKGNAALTTDWQQFTFDATTRDPESEPRAGIPIHFGLTDNQSKLPITFCIDDVEVTTPDGLADEDLTIQESYSLAQNYPNPFNPVTTIEFSLPVSDNVRMYLSDMLGRVVQDIAVGKYDAGTHQVSLNLSNLSSGIYFYTLETGSFVSTKKLVLMK